MQIFMDHYVAKLNGFFFALSYNIFSVHSVVIAVSVPGYQKDKVGEVLSFIGPTLSLHFLCAVLISEQLFLMHFPRIAT